MSEPHSEDAFAPPTASPAPAGLRDASATDSWPVLLGVITMIYGAVVASCTGMGVAFTVMIPPAADTTTEVVLGQLDVGAQVLYATVALSGVPVGLWALLRPGKARWPLLVFAVGHIVTELLVCALWVAKGGGVVFATLSAVPFLFWPAVLLLAAPGLKRDHEPVPASSIG